MPAVWAIALALCACSGGSSLTSSAGSSATAGGGVDVGGSGSGTSGGGTSGGTGGSSGAGSSGGGSSSGGGEPGQIFEVEVEGLTVSLNGQAPATITSDGGTLFLTPSFALATGASFTLTLVQAPSNDTCSIANASGVFVSGYAIPTITCTPGAGSPSSLAHLHAWEAATAQAPALPAGRTAPAIWMDAAGNVWLFGGLSTGSPESSSALLLNDLWKFVPAKGQWLRILVGTGPDARMSAASWVDAAGDFWLSGGIGAVTQNEARLADVWRFSPGTEVWTEVSSSAP